MSAYRLVMDKPGMMPGGSIEASPIQIGTRGSRLAIEQSRLVLARLHEFYPERATELVVVETQGDLDRVSSLQEIGGRGVFTSALERAICDGAIDGAIHSAKDVPTTLDPAVPLLAFPLRDDPRDALVTRHHSTLIALPPNPIIGSSSRRRAVQIRLLRPDARIVSIRGNVDTRLRKSENEDLDGVVLAAAGMHRLGLADRISQYFAPEDLVPSPGQGAIAIQARIDAVAASILASLNDCAISSQVNIERAFLAAVGAGCTAAVGALAVPNGQSFRFLAMLSDEAGVRTTKKEVVLTPGDAMDHVAALALEMKREVDGAPREFFFGAGEVVRPTLQGARVIVTRPRHQAGQLLEILEQRGATAFAMPLIRIEPLENPAPLDGALQDAAAGIFHWIVFTSVNSVAAVAGRMETLGLDPAAFANLRVAAVGSSTASAALAAGFIAPLTGTESSAAALARAIVARADPGERVLYPRSQIGRDELVATLEAAGLSVDAVGAYRTVSEENIDPQLVDQVKRGDIDAITFSSPSSVHTLTTLVGNVPSILGTIPAVCSGPITAAAARDAGLFVAATSLSPDPEAMAQAVADSIGRTQVDSTQSSRHDDSTKAETKRLG